MKFDIIVGNPPYNNDLYIDFERFALENTRIGFTMVTPAKFYAKGGEQNDWFRHNIVARMTKMVNFLDALDIFPEIKIQGGIAYYWVGKEETNSMIIKNVCSRCPANDTNGQFEVREKNLDNLFINSNKLMDLCRKVGVFDDSFEQLRLNIRPQDGAYNVFITGVVANAGGGTFSAEGTVTMLAPTTIAQEPEYRSSDTVAMYSHYDINKVESFVSYISTKFVRFMLLMRFSAYHNYSPFCWAYVPSVEYNHIYTDEELFDKFKLTDEERKIILNHVRDYNKAIYKLD